MKSICLIDLSGIFRSAWAVTADQPVSTALTQTVARVHELRSDFDYCAVCLDAPPYRRKQISADYKAQRDKPDAAMLEQFARTKQRLSDDGLHLFSADGYEADDVIATLVAQALQLPEAERLSITIMSADKDLLQLVSDKDHVRAFSPQTGAMADEAAVELKFKVKPQGMRDYLALTGDKSDNIKGVDKVGPVNAALVVNSGPGLDGALEGEVIQHLSIRLADAIVAARELVSMNRDLVTLETDAPVKLSDVFAAREPKSAVNSVLEAEFEDEPGNEFNRPRSAPPPPADHTGATTGAKPSEPRKVTAPTALVKRPDPPHEWALQLEPCTTAEAWTMACKLYESRLFAQFTTANAIFAVILRGRSLGIDAVTSLSNFHVIDGKPTMHASLIVGLVLKSGLAEYFELVKSTDEGAEWATKRKGGRREVIMGFSVRDALNAGLMIGTPDDARGVPSKSGKPSNWDRYRKTMMRWRGAVELARAVYPDVTTGIYTPDEISDGTHNPDIEAKYAAA